MRSTTVLIKNPKKAPTQKSSDSTSITSIDATTAPAQPGDAAGLALPQDFLGTWSGTGVQSDLKLQWDVVLTLNGGNTGSVVGTLTYPGLGCEGTLTLLDFDTIYPPYATLAETIVTGQGVCANGEFEVSFLEGVQGMSFTWTSSSSGSIANGTLQRSD